MRVAVIAPSEIPARRANTMQVMKMCQAISALGHEVRLAVPAAGAARSVDETQWGELAHHYGLKQRFTVDWLTAIPQLRRYDFGFRSVGWARGWNADLLYTRLPQAAAIGSMLGVPTIYEVHDLPKGLMAPLLFRAFLRGRGKRRLVVITHSLLYDLADKFSAPVDEPFSLVAPDGVDLSRYTNLPGRDAARRSIEEGLGVSLSDQVIVAGYTGHLYRGRGVELMLTMAAGLPEAIFLLVGGEPQDVERLQLQSQQAGLSNVILTGFIPNAELPVYQAACDVLLMPYQRHVAASSGGDIARYLSPMKLFEYMASGRPILSSDLPVLKEVLEQDFAIFLPPDDANSWVTAIQGLSEDAQRRADLGREARMNADRYSWESRAQRILEGIML